MSSPNTASPTLYICLIWDTIQHASGFWETYTYIPAVHWVFDKFLIPAEGSTDYLVPPVGVYTTVCNDYAVSIALFIIP